MSFRLGVVSGPRAVGAESRKAANKVGKRMSSSLEDEEPDSCDESVKSARELSMSSKGEGKIGSTGVRSPFCRVSA